MALDLGDDPFDQDDQFLELFPGAVQEPGELEPAPDPSPRDEAACRPPIERSAPTADLLGGVATRFQDALETAGIEVDASTLMASLAAVYSSQFVLFAGPSGTGKSTLARALMDFIVPEEAQAVIEARRQLVGPEDLTGFLSPFTGEFSPGLDLGGLMRLATDEVKAAAPSLLVEEVNLSTIEGYLSPLTHGLSSPSVPWVQWRLHPNDEDVDGIPATLLIQPFPRLLGTINVDATAMAPSPKVAARSCVLLLLPKFKDQSVSNALDALTGPRPKVDLDDEAMSLLGDPLSIIRDEMDLNERDAIAAEVHRVIQQVKGAGAQRFVPSRRQLAQMVTYASWFVWLADGYLDRGGVMAEDEDGKPLGPTTVAAENALLHFILPSLRPDVFSEVVGLLQGDSPAIPFSDPADDAVGSLLGKRFTDLVAGTTSSSRYLDFWDRLS